MIKKILDLHTSQQNERNVMAKEILKYKGMKTMTLNTFYFRENFYKYAESQGFLIQDAQEKTLGFDVLFQIDGFFIDELLAEVASLL